MQLSPNQLVAAAYEETGAFGIGQTPRASDLAKGMLRLQLMLSDWQAKKYLVWCQEEVLCGVDGTKESWTVGPEGDFDCQERPIKIQAAFFRFGPLPPAEGNGFAIGVGAIGVDPLGADPLFPGPPLTPNQLDVPLAVMGAREDFVRIRMKHLRAIPQMVYYEPSWPLGRLFPWPLPQAGSTLGIMVLTQLPKDFTSTEVADRAFDIPDVCYNAVVLNLAIRLRGPMRQGAIQGDALPILAADALQTMRGSFARVPQMTLPSGLGTRGTYNILEGS